MAGKSSRRAAPDSGRRSARIWTARHKLRAAVWIISGAMLATLWAVESVLGRPLLPWATSAASTAPKPAPTSESTEPQSEPAAVRAKPAAQVAAAKGEPRTDEPASVEAEQSESALAEVAAEPIESEVKIVEVESSTKPAPEAAPNFESPDETDDTTADYIVGPQQSPWSIRVTAEESEGGPSLEDATVRILNVPRELELHVNTAPLGRPGILQPPVDVEQPTLEVLPTPDPSVWEMAPFDAPLGFTGRSSVYPREAQENEHFIPIEDRWRIGFPEWDRYGKGHPPVDDYPYKEGRLIDPYNQNVLKGDYPIVGQHTFLNITLTSQALLEFRQVPTPTTPFESTNDPFEEEFFGDPDQFAYIHNFRLSFDLSHGDAGFKPADWRIRITPIFNINYLDVEELAVVNPDVTKGETRGRGDFALEEWFVETKIADLSPDYDFVSARAGSQFFVSDFRGFVFSDTNRAVRLFGTRHANRDQFNLLWFDQAEKETNSELNTFDDRHQNTVIANYYRQDFIWPGYTAQLSFHYNRDEASTHFDENDFLARPDPTGVFTPHEINAYYLGWTGDGHINRINVNHAFYYVLGEDELNPLAGRDVDINAQMAALELSYDRDWARFRVSAFWASGDPDIFDDDAEGFDAIFDNPNFAGGEFSYWQRQAVRLFGVNLVNRMSLIPNLRSSKTEGQTNFVNPGLLLANLGMDFDVTPKLRLITNVNFLWFDKTEVVERFIFQEHVDYHIGTDLSMGVEYRPWLNNNAILVAGVSGLMPGDGFEDIYDPIGGDVDGLFAAFMELVLTY